MVMSHFQTGKKVPEIYPFFSQSISRSNLYVLEKELRAGFEEEACQKQKRPYKKIDPKMAATIVRRLTVAKKHYSIRSIAKEFQLNEKSICTFLEKKGIRCYKKQKRNLIPANQQENGRFVVDDCADDSEKPIFRISCSSMNVMLLSKNASVIRTNDVMESFLR